MALSIADFWLYSQERSEVLGRLSPQARTALQRLVQFQSIPRTLFCTESGDLRPARSPNNRQSHPWRTPYSATEELAYSGLLFGNDGRPLHKTRSFLLPDELRPLIAIWLANAPNVPPAQLPPASLAPFSLDGLVHDLAELLSVLHRCQKSGMPLLRGRWLPTDVMRGLNRSLLFPDPLPLPRSHKRTQRLRYLMFWATAASLHHEGVLSPAGWQWFDLPNSQKLKLLWDGWKSAPGELRAAFAWPDSLMPDPWFQLFRQALFSLPDEWTVGDVATHLLAAAEMPDAYWIANLDRTHTLEQIISDLCTGPLAQLGFLTWTQTPDNPLYTFQLTQLGRDLLNDITPSDLDTHDPPHALCTWRQEDDLLIVERPASAITHGIAVLAGCAQHIETHHNEACVSHNYHLTADSMRKAALGGLTQPLLLTALQTLGIVMPPQQAAMLSAWLHPPTQIDVALATLLRTPSSQIMADLHRSPAVAAHLQRLLSPTSAVLDLTPDDARTLLRDNGFGAPLPAPPGRPTRQETDPAAIWLAGQLYEMMRHFLPLPLDPPFAAMAGAFASLPAAQQAVLTAWRDQMAQDLLDVLDGRTFTAPPHPTDPARWRPLLETAMTDGQWLDMLYFSPARNLPTRRRIQPAWFSQQPAPEYVIAYCQEAGAVLTFRLDRIQSLQPLAQTG